MNVRLIVLSAALAGTALTTVASAQLQPQPQPYAMNARHLRGDRGSDQNIRREYRRLEQIIDALQRDRHDYGGHREQAIDALQHARQQLDEALEYDRTHGPGR